MTVLKAQMELWGRLQHNTVRDSRYGPLGTDKTSFGELSGRSEKKFFFSRVIRMDMKAVAKKGSFEGFSLA